MEIVLRNNYTGSRLRETTKNIPEYIARANDICRRLCEGKIVYVKKMTIHIPENPELSMKKLQKRQAFVASLRQDLKKFVVEGEGNDPVHEVYDNELEINIKNFKAAKATFTQAICSIFQFNKSLQAYARATKAEEERALAAAKPAATHTDQTEEKPGYGERFMVTLDEFVILNDDDDATPTPSDSEDSISRDDKSSTPQ